MSTIVANPLSEITGGFNRRQVRMAAEFLEGVSVLVDTNPWCSALPWEQFDRATDFYPANKIPKYVALGESALAWQALADYGMTYGAAMKGQRDKRKAVRLIARTARNLRALLD